MLAHTMQIMLEIHLTEISDSDCNYDKAIIEMGYNKQ